VGWLKHATGGTGAAFLTPAGTMVAAAIVLLAVGRLATERRAEAAA
jgi:hypothetical protein